MDRREAECEDLPPLELRDAARAHASTSPPATGRPAHLSAGSGIVRRGDFAYVIGDDELFLAVFRLSAAGEPGELGARSPATCRSTTARARTPSPISRR